MKREEQTKPPLIVLAGPTAVGKSALAIRLAKRIGGEIISADSMQVYRGMDIGTAKLRPEEMQGVKHYLIDELDPREEFHVVKFQEYANRSIREILSHHKIPMLVGGSGFYIQAVLYEIDFTGNGEDHACRDALQKLADEEGPKALHDLLSEVDPDSAEKIHENNVKRMIRALEFYYETGTRISEHNSRQRQKSSPFSFVYFVLNEQRQVLYEQIDRRVDEMIRQGLPEEVRALQKMGCTPDLGSMQALGYKELFPYLNGESTLLEAAAQLKKNTRHFAKRQISWFKREPEAIWIDKEKFGYEDDKILDEMTEVLREKKI